ncbi:MAG TPA: sigma 54-interacting transcriptional regulator, partial [Candidatus Acidoferrum sp.]|nr:sigma 54-interacting transcriptional regulator [Candidatus Acidoferrum sp.]
MNNPVPVIERETSSPRYEAVVRISEAIAACREPEELARTLADEIGDFLHFDHLYFTVFKENSREIEYLVWGKGSLPFPDLPIEELPMWQAMESGDPQHTADWDAEQGFPRFKEWAQKMRLGSGVRVPLTTPHRRLGVFGISRDTVNPFNEDDIGFLRLVGRVVAFALDDGLNLRRAQSTHACLQSQNERLQLLLNLTNRITSNLKLRELLRAVAANIREVMLCDAVAVSLVDAASGTSRLYVLDFPQGKGFIKEERVLAIAGAAKRVLETLKPAVLNKADPSEVPAEIYDEVVAEGLKSTCLFPLINRGRALGILTIARTTEAPFTPYDIEFLTQAAGQIAIAIENAIAYHEISELKDKLAQEKLYLEEEIRGEMNFENIVGNSPRLKHVLELVETVAPNDSTVLLLGETGTGKELIARAIHDRSRRENRTFVKMNCAAIPTGLLESELFGHEKGAFTGAIAQKVGRLELADQGTLFLDEVGDIPIEIQPKLLRALQEREFERLGSIHTRKVNIRLVAATNRDLEEMIAKKEFRSDLYYRLNVFPIRIPPLRERKEDIPLLVSYFVQKFAKQMQKKIEGISPAVMKGLTAWEWPGNIRELENFIERAVILTRSKSLEAPLAELRRSNTQESAVTMQGSGKEDIVRIVKETLHVLNGNKTASDERAQKQREEIVRALGESKGRVGGADGAAARMGVNRTTLLSRMKKLGIDPGQYANRVLDREASLR